MASDHCHHLILYHINLRNYGPNVVGGAMSLQYGWLKMTGGGFHNNSVAAGGGCYLDGGKSPFDDVMVEGNMAIWVS